MNEMKKFLFEAAMGYDYCKSCHKGSTMEEMLSEYGLSYQKYLPEITRIQRLCTYNENGNKKIRFGNKKDFLEWYLKKWSLDGSAVCEYCGISEKECNELLNTQRKSTRGRHLEVERREPNLDYDSTNCILACYVCNNTKSDFMSEEEFRVLIPGIQAFWKSQRNKKKQN